MAKARVSRTGLLATFKYPARVEIRAADFEPHSLLRYLDVSMLSKGNHKIEVGVVKGGCCGKKAFAIIKKGMVVAVGVEPCEESKKPLSTTDRALVAAAYKKIGRRWRKWVPVRVEDVFGKAAVARWASGIFDGTCLTVCVGEGTDLSHVTCISCCKKGDRFVCEVNTQTSG